MQSEENDLDNTFQGQISSFYVFSFSWAPPNQILQFQQSLSARKAILNIYKRCMKTQQWVLSPQAQQYTVVISTQVHICKWLGQLCCQVYLGC